MFIFYGDSCSVFPLRSAALLYLSSHPPPRLSCALQVTGTMGSMRSGLHQHLARLDEIFATRGDYVQTLQFMQQMADNVIKQLLGLPDWEEAKVDLASIADQTANVEYYR